jgi:hypothetical protein
MWADEKNYPNISGLLTEHLRSPKLVGDCDKWGICKTFLDCKALLKYAVSVDIDGRLTPIASGIRSNFT